MSQSLELFDATGQVIVMGKRYSTISKHRNADTQVIGLAKTVSKLGQIGLHIERRLEPRRNPSGGLPPATYQDMTFGDWGFEKRTVSYHPGVLFPVTSEPARFDEPKVDPVDKYALNDSYMSGQYD